MSRIRHRSFVVVVGMLALAALPACDPAPERPVFVVTSLSDGLDRAVGDGVCEVTEGGGDCSLRAAVAEADAAAGGGDVVVRAGTHRLTVSDPHDGDPDLDVTGDVRINWQRRDEVVVEAADGGVLEVHAGARVAAHGLTLANDVNHPGAVVRVAGTLILGESTVSQGLELATAVTEPALDVDDGATVALSNSEVWGTTGAAAVVNRGVVHARFSTISGLFVPAVHTDPGATTHLGASKVTRYTHFIRAIVEDATGAVCTGEPSTSSGYNRVNNATCGLSGPSDAQAPGLPWVDVVPDGVLGCGEAYAFDGAGAARPADGDFDGTPACDAGATERGQAITITTGSLPPATVGSCYSGTLFGNGATRPYTWSAAGLPQGLTLVDDRIVGIPEQAGSFEVHIVARAVDGGGTTTITIDVAPSSDPPMVSC